MVSFPCNLSEKGISQMESTISLTLQNVGKGFKISIAAVNGYNSR